MPNDPQLAEAIRSFLDEGLASPEFASRLAALGEDGATVPAPAPPEIEPTPDELRTAAGFVVHYICTVLDDHHLSEDEQRRIRDLKRYFRLDEGDLLRLQKEAITNLLLAEMGLILRDTVVDTAEEIHQVDLQRALDLGYDQFLELIEARVRPTVEGLLNELRATEYPSPHLRDSVFKRLQLLSTVIPLDPATLAVEWSGTTNPTDATSPDGGTRAIPQAVRDAVWRRDHGRCAVCGSQDRLEFDHIIPFSKGGSSTYRNVQLLCQDCNRTKSAQIG